MLSRDPGLQLLDVVEFVTPDPEERLALYRSLAKDVSRNRQSGYGSEIDLNLLQRRATAEGYELG